MSIIIPAPGQYQLWPIDRLRPYPNNPRENDDAVAKMAVLIRTHGFRVPVIVAPDGAIHDGHLRWKAARQLGMKRVPVLVVNRHMTPAEAAAFRISVNRAAEESDWDAEKLIDELKLAADGLTNLELADLTGFDEDEVEAFLAPDEEEGLDEDPDADEDTGLPRKTGTVHEVDILAAGRDTGMLAGESPVVGYKNEVEFDQVGSMGLPSIRADRLLDCPAPVTWAGADHTVGDPPYLYNYSTDTTVGLEWNQAIVAFYTADHKFENVWSKTADVVTRFRNLKVRGVVTPDFSTFYRWPRAWRAFNLFRSRWVGRYMQEAGIPIVVNVSGSDADIDIMFDGLPAHCPMCVQLQARYTAPELKRETRILQAVLDFRPKRLWVYAPNDRRLIFPLLKGKSSVEFITPRMVVRRPRK